MQYCPKLADWAMPRTRQLGLTMHMLTLQMATTAQHTFGEAYRLRVICAWLNRPNQTWPERFKHCLAAPHVNASTDQYFSYDTEAHLACKCRVQTESLSRVRRSCSWNIMKERTGPSNFGRQSDASTARTECCLIASLTDLEPAPAAERHRLSCQQRTHGHTRNPG